MTSMNCSQEIRNWRVATAISVFLLLILSPGFVAASSDDESYSRSGFYIGLSGIYTNNFFDDQIEDAFSDLIGSSGAAGSANVDTDDSSGVNARVGYRATSWFAIELQYEWVDNFETTVGVAITSPVPATASATIDITGHSLTLNTKLIVPTWRIQPYILLGAGYSLYDAEVNLDGIQAFASELAQVDGGKESGFAARAGAGVDVYVTSNIVVNGEITALVTTQDFSTPNTGSIDNLYYLSFGVGLQYRF